MPYGLSRVSVVIGLAVAAVLVVVLRAGGLVPAAAAMTALAGGAAAVALSDALVAKDLTDRGLMGRVAVAVTCPLAVGTARLGLSAPPEVMGGLAFAAGIAAGALAVGVRRRWRRPRQG